MRFGLSFFFGGGGPSKVEETFEEKFGRTRIEAGEAFGKNSCQPLAMTAPSRRRVKVF